MTTKEYRIKTSSPYEIIIISINVSITHEKKKDKIETESYTLKIINFELLWFNIPYQQGQ